MKRMVFIMQDFEEKKIDIKSLTLEELKQYLGNQTDTGEEMESYSRFLYKLEKKKDITQCEGVSRNTDV